MRILVTGGTGFIGSRVTTLALERGMRVRVLARREWVGPPAVPLVDRVFGRLPHDVPARAFDGCDAVVHCAVSTAGDVDVARAVNVAGTLALARGARDAGARAFVFLSSQSARDDTPSPYGRTKYEAEVALLADPSLHAIVLRPGLVCGDGGLFARLAATVRRAPITPLLAGDAPVQPVWVDDLARAILSCVERPADLEGRIHALGLADALSLHTFVGLVAEELGLRRRVAPLPAGPVALALRVVERAGLRLPISSVNVTGARHARASDTRPGNAALAMPQRSAREIIRLALVPARVTDAASAQAGPSRTLLIGAGRIGIVHAVTLSRLPGTVLAGMLDRRPQALGLLRSVGVTAPGYTADDAAHGRQRYDAVVVATPPATHVTLTRAALARGERVLVEKPAAHRPDDLAELEDIGARLGDRVLVGYLMPRMPQLRPWIAKLRSGGLGGVRSFTGLTLLSFVDERSGPRWETTKAVSGGGVLANSSTHVLSLIHEAFGPPAATSTEVLRRHSREVEDAALVRFEYPGFSGTHFSSWSMPGFPRQENRLVVVTERGRLTLTATTALFEEEGGRSEIDHQLDHDVGFNLAPDYAGAGIATELRELVGHRFAGPDAEPLTLARALGYERLLFALYGQAVAVPRFTAAPVPADGGADSATAEPDWGRVVVDAREASAEVLAVARERGARRLLVRAAQLDELSGTDTADLAVTIPDFLAYTRLINDRQTAALAGRLGAAGIAAAARAGLAGTLRHRGVGFWPVASALLSAELARVPDGFSGTLLLHPYLADLAIALGRLDVLASLLGRMRAKRRARLGVHSNLGREAANAMLLLERPPEVLSLLVSPNGSTLADVAPWLQSDRRTRELRLVAEVGPAPLAVHRLALVGPGRWSPQGDVVATALALAAHDEDVHAAWRREWERTFPGTAAPPLGWAR